MKAKITKTLKNVKGEEVKEGEIVEVLECWINNIDNRIFVEIKYNDFKIITSAEYLEYIDLSKEEYCKILNNE